MYVTWILNSSSLTPETAFHQIRDQVFSVKSVSHHFQLGSQKIIFRMVFLKKIFKMLEDL